MVFDIAPILLERGGVQVGIEIRFACPHCGADAAFYNPQSHNWTCSECEISGTLQTLSELLGVGADHFADPPPRTAEHKPNDPPPFFTEADVNEAIDAADSQAWIDDLKMTKRGAVKSCLANLIVIFENHPSWRGALAYDERALREVVIKPPPVPGDFEKGQQLDDQLARLAAVWLAQRSGFDLTTGSNLIHESLVTVARRHAFDPVRQYLESLEWDGIDRLDAILPDLIGCPSTDYTRAIGSKFLISAAARTFRPGCKVDTMLVLVGPQGSLKSTLLATLAGEFFSDQLEDVGTKDSMLQLHGPLLIEMSELDAMNKREASTVKAFLTAQVDMFRPPYGRVTYSFPRRCIFAGTTNQETFLRDDTGGRRFWPVQVSAIDLDAARVNRDQYWAEAVHRFKAGENWWLEQDVERDAAEEQEARRQGDPWEDELAFFLRDTLYTMNDKEKDQFDSRTGKRLYTTIDECFGHLAIQRDRQDRFQAMRVGQILRAFGWRRTRKTLPTGARVWIYRMPEDWGKDRPAEPREPEQTSF